MTHLSEEDLILLYYSEPGAPANAAEHLGECAVCRAAAESLAYALSVCNEWTVPERTADFGRDVWLRLVPALDSRVARTGNRWRWLAAATLAVLLAGVFFAGRYSRTSQTSSPDAAVMAGLSDQARERILAISVADHLDRVQMLLTEIANGNDSGPQHFAAERERAENLVQEGRLMRQSLAARGDTSTAVFLDEVERFLIGAAHTPDSATTREVRDLRDRIESESLLFKVRIVESNLRNEFT